MKINTKEKLQILLFGLNAGNNLDVFYLQRIDTVRHIFRSY
jgi:hypothetical protein